MKEWMEKIRKGKGWPLLMLLGLCMGFSVLLSINPEGQPLSTQEEKRIAQALSLIQGAGECRVILHYEKEAAAFSQAQGLTGALIIAQGAEEIAVRLRLMQAAETLLGLAPSQVEIFPMEDGP